MTSPWVLAFAAAFWPKPVIVRMSDFTSNEYASLPGGSEFAPTEENPMLGFRGAPRYVHPVHEEGLAFERRAMYEIPNTVVQIDAFAPRFDGIHSGRCGHAPSDYPEFAAFLTRFGIDSISLNPDSVLKGVRTILEAEAIAAPVPAGAR